jgi:hypothetical protein
MTPEDAIAALDRQLAQNGETVVLQRLTGAAQVGFSVDCRAFVRGYRPSELAGNVAQGDSMAVISPTDIKRAGWPGGFPLPGRDPLVPVKGDKLVVAGRQRAIEAAAPIYLGGELVRIELQVKG